MTTDAGLLVLRLVVGLLFIGHGAQKLFGWFEGPGLTGTAAWLGSLGFRPPRFWAVLAGLSEFVGGLLLVLGFLTPLGSLGIIASMLTAIARVHWKSGLWVAKGGFEYPLVNIAVVAVIGLLGAGAISLDALLGTQLPLPISFWIGLAVVVIGWVVGLVASRQPVQQPQARPSETETRRAA